MKHPNLTFLFLLSLTACTFGQDIEKDYPIDIAWKHCHSLDSNWTRHGLTDCELVASEKWDAEMNRYYKLLKDLLTGEQFKSLKLAQKQWIKYRDAELEYSSKLFWETQGTMWQMAAKSRQRQLNRTRALELKGYFDNQTASKEK